MEVEFFFDEFVSLDEAVHPVFQLLGDLAHFDHTIEGFQVASPFEVAHSEVGQDVAEAVDVVGERQAGDQLNEGQAEGLLGVGGSQVPEPHRQHHCGAPIIPPDIPLEPGTGLDALLRQPIALRVQQSHHVHRH